MNTQLPLEKRYLHPEDRDKWLDILHRLGKVKGCEVLLLRKDGTAFWALLNSISQAPVNGESFIVSIQDIDERKQAEAALRESELFNSSLLRNLPNPIIVLNPDTSIRYVNPALEKITGFSSSELLGKNSPLSFLA
jgi:PAS domain-containing protein